MKTIDLNQDELNDCLRDKKQFWFLIKDIEVTVTDQTGDQHCIAVLQDRESETFFKVYFIMDSNNEIKTIAQQGILVKPVTRTITEYLLIE